MRNVKISFNKQEINDIFLSWLAISLAFGIVFNGVNTFLPLVLLFSGITAGLGFILHELAHKFVAFRRGCSAYYKANKPMLWITILLSFVGFIFAAPGAVIVRGVNNKKDNGIISAAGPLANIILGFIFFFLFFLFPNNNYFSKIFTYGLLINSWLALFNMIPIMPFDGFKIIVWNKLVYGSMVVISLLLLLVNYL